MFRKGYIQNDVDTLANNGRKAFFDFTPMQRFQSDPERIFRKISYGKNLDVFLLDPRSYRSPTTIISKKDLMKKHHYSEKNKFIG